MREEWREIEGYPDYEVSNLGRVRSYKTPHKGFRRDRPKQLKLIADHDGYQEIQLCNEEGCKWLKVHHLVLDAFVGKRLEGQETRHLDDNPKNNDVRNICWGTSLENKKDMVSHGRHPRGIKPFKEDVLSIQERRDNLESVSSIAKSFPRLGRNVVDAVIKGTHWSLEEE